MIVALILLLLAVLLAVETPIAFAVGVIAFAGLMVSGIGTASVSAQRMFAGMNSYGLLALPLFILAGNLLVAGGSSTGWWSSSIFWSGGCGGDSPMSTFLPTC
jgi:C4-dicarboxylate transporter DctM subunit